MTIPGRGVVRDQGVRAESSREGPAKPSEQKRGVNRVNVMKVGCQLSSIHQVGCGPAPLRWGPPKTRLRPGPQVGQTLDPAVKPNLGDRALQPQHTETLGSSQLEFRLL